MEPVLILAPLKGVTDKIYRNAFSKFFGGFDRAVAPFIAASASANITSKFLREFNPSSPCGIHTEPQILSNNPDDFIQIANALFDLGHKTVNWNLGCPFPMVVNKNKGSGLLRYPNHVLSFLDKTVSNIKCSLSIKMRIGFDEPDSVTNLIPSLNDYPLSDLIIHPRTSKQMYKGEVDLKSFAKCVELSKHEITFNGDINSVLCFDKLNSEFALKKWMIGRGAIRNPFLPLEIKRKAPATYEEKIMLIKGFHNYVFSEYSAIMKSQTHILDKMKGQWFYLSDFFPSKSKEIKRIKKTTTINNFIFETENIFSL